MLCIFQTQKLIQYPVHGKPTLNEAEESGSEGQRWVKTPHSPRLPFSYLVFKSISFLAMSPPDTLYVPLEIICRTASRRSALDCSARFVNRSASLAALDKLISSFATEFCLGCSAVRASAIPLDWRARSIAVLLMLTLSILIL